MINGKFAKGSSPLFSRVILINAALTVVISVIFAGTIFYLRNSVKNEKQAEGERVLENFIEKFLDETDQLRDSVFMLKDSPAFILSANNQLSDNSVWREYTYQVSTQLEMLRSLHSAADSAFLYIRNTQQFVTDEYSISSKEVFLEVISETLAEDENIPDFDGLSDGWVTYENFAFYTVSVYNYGRIVLQIDTQEIADIQDVSSVNPELNIIVLDKYGYYFSSSIANQNNILNRIDYSNYIDGGEVTLPGSDEGIICRIKIVESGDFTFLLLSDIATIENSYAILNYISLGVITVEMVILILMLWINSVSPRMLRKVLSKYGYSSNDHAIEFLDEKFQQYETRQKEITAENELWRKMQLNVSMNYLLETEKELPERLLAILSESFNKYFIIYMVGQDEAGGIDNTIYSELDEYLSDFYYFREVAINLFEKIYIVEKDDYKTDPKSILKQFFYDVKVEMRFFAGISGAYDDISMLRDAVLEARRDLGSTKMSEDMILSVTNGDTKKRQYPGISINLQRAVVEAAMNSNTQKLRETLRLILFETEGMRFRDFQSAYHILTDQLQVVINSLGADSRDISLTTPKINQFYNPLFFYKTILIDYRAVSDYLSQAKNEQHGLKFEVISYINNNYKNDLTLESVADHFDITSVYLSRWFKAKNGINFSAYLSNLRIEKAILLIQENPYLKNQEIAKNVGISNSLTFLRQFKSFLGRTPDQFKKECIRKQKEKS